MKRRIFLSNTSKAIGGLALMNTLPTSAFLGKHHFLGANDKIRVGVIGCKGMGWSDTTSFLKIPQVQVVALCDVDSNVLLQRNNDLQKLTGKNATTHGDYRKLLDNKAIDAVIIGTPDHWHALPMIHACETGKDV